MATKSLGLPDVIERMSPADGDRVLRQSQIIVDFVEGYEAVMFIDGIELTAAILGRDALPLIRLETPRDRSRGARQIHGVGNDGVPGRHVTL